MIPGKISAKTVAAKLEALQEMIRGINLLPLRTPEEFLVDPRMAAAGESYLRRALEALLDLGRHVLARGFAFLSGDHSSRALPYSD